MEDTPFFDEGGLMIIGSEKLCDPDGWPDPELDVVVPDEFITDDEDG